ncbi:alpha/beta fold hydrolase [Streptomyces yaizuensis]|uniref:Alpha/beta fold hydrolase n=1 Tax=Streptomyces yaizuensis TaxID=2989713 RepID=A0ABQ5NVY3_9ACTN|nr:alpha/beta hydrolase [Streptomyces sp. YSPA8]GLF94501.1 alpha/beta fold hydrolase [Streptomyces sp. YSPA8]
MSRPPTFVPPACARSRTLRTARGDFAVLDARPGSGPIRGTALLLPGFTGSKEDFIAMLDPLAAAGYRVVSVDGRGQYETEGPADEQAYAQGELARDVLAQAEAVGDGGPLHLLGHSLGGQIARAAALLDRSPFRTFTAMSSGPARICAAQREKVRLLSEALTVLSMADVWEAMQAMDPPEETATDGEDLRRRWMLTQPLQLVTTGRQLSVEPDRVDALAALEPLPKHVISGERDDTWPVEEMDGMAVRLGAHRTVIAGAGHSPNTDRPAETSAAVAAFWDAHPAV